MSILMRHFGTVLAGVILILIGIDVVLLYYSAVNPSILMAINVVFIGLLLLYRGLTESSKGERKFYFIWSLILIDIAVAVLTSTVTGSVVLGISIFIVGLGSIVIYTVR
ncbi:MAG: hypothetical protein QXJ56_06385 [Ignisphaera sp.]|uniref:Multipass membrane protein n=1 Tax=Ignisphaera aggregans TaxID=334771 RepID=A0A7J3I5L8_9CREN